MADITRYYTLIQHTQSFLVSKICSRLTEMHSHRSSICTRQYLNDDICMTIWLYFCCQQQHLLFLVAFANSSLSIIYFSGACIWFDSSFHIQFHAFKFLNEIVQRVSFYINIMHLFFSVSVFFFF